jgi:hypothetical protein
VLKQFLEIATPARWPDGRRAFFVFGECLKSGAAIKTGWRSPGAFENDRDGNFGTISIGTAV